MIVNQRRIDLPIGLATAPVANNRATVFASDEINRLSQIDKDGIETNIAYPSFTTYVNYQFDCETTPTTATYPGWKVATIATGTTTQVTTGIASGTPTASQALDLANHPGAISFNSSTTNGSGAHIFWGNVNTRLILRVGSVFDAVVYVPIVTTTTLRIGFHNSSTATNPTDGMYWDLDGSGVFSFRVRVANTQVWNNVSVANLVAGRWYHFQIKVTSPTTLEHTIYNMDGTIHDGRMPTVSSLPLGLGNECTPKILCLSANTTAKLMLQVDFIRFASPAIRGALS